MNLFFVLIIFIYALGHLLFWLRLRRVFAWGSVGRVGGLMGLTLLMLLPFMGRWMLTWGWIEAGRLLSLAGFYWLGIFFTVFCLDGVLIVLALLQGRFGRFKRSVTWIKTPAVLWMVMGAALCINLYGFFEASRVTVTRMDLFNPAMSPSAAPIRIVQVSDVHYGLTKLLSRHNILLEYLHRLNPDMIVSTGDFIDSGAVYDGTLMDAWQEFQPRLGKYAILGNHEVIAGLDSSLALLKRAGFKVLRGEVQEFGVFRLIGLEDPRTGLSNMLHFSPEELADKPGFSILLNHRPGWPESMENFFDLSLAGHTHGGQIFPFGFFVYFAQGVLSGLQSTPWGGWNYVSRGVGTWGPPVRLWAEPEITLLVMQHGQTKHLVVQESMPESE